MLSVSVSALAFFLSLPHCWDIRCHLERMVMRTICKHSSLWDIRNLSICGCTGTPGRSPAQSGTGPGWGLLMASMLLRLTL